jgi:hypothetical protein
MSTIELREKLRLLSREERQEMLAVLQELEAVEDSSPDKVARFMESKLPEAGGEPASGPTHKVSFEDAMDYTFKNFDTALRKLAQ